VGALILGGMIGAAVARAAKAPTWLGAAIGAILLQALRLATSPTFNP
jgi:hypothetical protein